MLNGVSNELYASRAFLGMTGSGYQLAGNGFELAGDGGIPKRKINKALKDTGKFLKNNKGKIARSTMNLASQFGSPAAQDAVEKIRMGHEIIKGSGPAAPGAALRRLVQ